MAAAAAHIPKDSASGRGSPRVLVVDDDADTVMTLLAILRDEGYEAEGFSHPLEALAALCGFDPDVVICDLAMPVMSGWDFARKVRRKMGDARPMLIALSGVYNKNSDKMLSTLAGYAYFVSKPCDPGVLISVVAKARGGEA